MVKADKPGLRMLHRGRTEKALGLVMKDPFVRAAMKPLARHDGGSYKHSMDVARLAIDMGFGMSLPHQAMYLLAYGSALHDLGKLDVSPEILNKNGKPTTEERIILNAHPEQSYSRIMELDGLYDLESIAQVAFQHHDFTDHGGTTDGDSRPDYPQTIVRSDDSLIVKLAKIVAVADIVASLACPRPYRPFAFSSDKIGDIVVESFRSDGVAARLPDLGLNGGGYPIRPGLGDHIDAVEGYNQALLDPEMRRYIGQAMTRLKDLDLRADLDASLQGERRYSGDFVGQGAEQIGPDGDTDVFATNVFYLSDISRTLPAVGINAPDHYAARTIPFPALHAEELPSVAATA
jgi:hypothetical protein